MPSGAEAILTPDKGQHLPPRLREHSVHPYHSVHSDD